MGETIFTLLLFPSLVCNSSDKGPVPAMVKSKVFSLIASTICIKDSIPFCGTNLPANKI